MNLFDTIIIGAGPAGSVAAAYLQKQGKQVLVLEKTTFPRFVIGESLLPHCVDNLIETDLFDVVEKQKFQLKTGAVFHKMENQLGFEFSEKSAEGFDYAWQVKREKFDKVLIDEVANRGVDVRFNCAVTAVSCSDEKQVVTFTNPNGDEEVAEAKFIIDASGYGRVLPRLFDLNIPSDLTPRGAIFTHVNDVNRTQSSSQNIFVHAFKNNSAWVWAIPFEDGTTSVGVVGENAYIEELGQNNGAGFTDVITNFEGLYGRFVNADQLFEPRTILGYSIGVKQMFGEGYVLSGNSTEFLDPIFSSGVTLATASGLLAAKLTNRKLDGENVDFQTEYEDVINYGVAVFRSYIDAWYNGDLQTILFSKNIKKEFKEQICSALAGYVWDPTNPFIKKHKTILSTLASVIKMQ